MVAEVSQYFQALTTAGERLGPCPEVCCCLLLLLNWHVQLSSLAMQWRCNELSRICIHEVRQHNGTDIVALSLLTLQFLLQACRVYSCSPSS